MNKMDKGERNQNIQQAKRKIKNSRIAILCCVAVFILFSLLGGLSYIPTWVTIPICFIAFFVLLFFIFKINAAKKVIFTIRNLFCQECGTQFTREDATYEVVRNRTSSKRENSKSNNVVITTYADLKIFCTCKNCKNKHDFSHSVVIEKKTVTPLNVTVSGTTYEIEEGVRKLFDI